MAINPFVIGNWKMNGLGASLAEIENLIAKLRERPVHEAHVMICPPATLISRAAAVVAGSAVGLGAQDCHAQPSGAHTGDISAEMLADAGASAVIVGHSERRIDHGETDSEVAAKAEAAQRAGLTTILCIGETEAERQNGKALDVIGRQLAGSLPQTLPADSLLIAYEPVWAIGTGLTPTPADIEQVHGFIRDTLVERLGEAGPAVPILYGGSVKPNNAELLLAVPEVNGALVGGASLKADDFYGILATYA